MSERPDALQRLRGAHEAVVLGELRRSGALSRSELMRRVGLSRTTLFAIVSDLLQREAVVEQTAAAQQRGRGRPPTEITLNPRGAELIGIELQRNRTHIVVVNSAHEIVGRHRAPVPGEAGPAERVDAITGAVGELLRERRIALAPLQGIGLGLPGFVQDPASADPRSMTPFAARIAAALERHFHAPVVVDNNARLAALAEVTWGAARGHDNAVYLRWSDGVGGGLVTDGRLVRGAHGTAGEIGHTSCDPGGPPCHCGGRGCLEAEIRLPALLTRCAERGVRVRDADELLSLAESGEETVRTVLREAAALAGRVLAALAAHTDPECIMIDGEPAALEDPVLTTIREQVRTLSLPTAPRDITVCRAALGADAAARGAVALLLHSHGQDLERLMPRPAPGFAASAVPAAEGGRR
ncbi:ROK family protein [Streptomyces sp. NPDC058534]|uniref:ROK family protein n=1 Tax=Streptomyces sp. NPDC058534 TaxID=3346541 RepID=UPI00364C1CE9